MSTNTLGRYQIIREIARSNDIVYEAVDPSRGQRIALKELLIPPNLVGQPRQERIERFTREARAAASLKHPNVVRILDHGHVQGRYYIAMEFLEGQSLRDVLRQRVTFPFQEALRITAAVADGLEFAHRHGVVHRDVKPDNVHLEPDGRVVITDFGIARLTFEPTLTADGQIFGTPSYMSPEQVAGKGIDKRSDVFSLGVMLYELIAGRKPFTGDSVITITYNIMNMEPPPIAGAPAGLDAVIRHAMAKDPGRRYRSAAELAEDLRLLAQGGMPRHAVDAQLGPSSGRWPGPQGSAPAHAPLPQRPHAPAPAPSPAARPMPQPRFGGAVPGARPMPAPPPPATFPRPVPARGGPGAPVAARLPPGTPFPTGIPAGSFQAAPARRRSGGSDWVWLVSWLGVAIVIALMILTLVWASVTAYDRFRKEDSAAAVRRVRASAQDALGQGRYEEALNAWLQVASGSTGADRVFASRQAAVAAVELANHHLDASKLPEAERVCRQAIQLDPNYASAYVALGRVQAAQGNVDAALASFDEAPRAADRTARSGAEARVVNAAREAAAVSVKWKADALYKDGVSQVGKNDLLAQQRFEAVLRAAPDSEWGRGARAQLQQLSAGSGAAGPAAGNAPAAPGGPAPMPGGWDPSYRNPFGNDAGNP